MFGHWLPCIHGICFHVLELDKHHKIWFHPCPPSPLLARKEKKQHTCYTDSNDDQNNIWLVFDLLGRKQYKDCLMSDLLNTLALKYFRYLTIQWKGSRNNGILNGTQKHSNSNIFTFSLSLSRFFSSSSCLLRARFLKLRDNNKIKRNRIQVVSAREVAMF